MLGLTGVTGDLGSLVADRIIAQWKDPTAPLVLFARDPNKALSRITSPISHLQIITRPIDYSNPDLTSQSFEGITTLFFISGMEDPNRLTLHKNIVDAAVTAKIQHIIYTSFYNPSPTSTFHHARDHYHTEQHIISKPSLKYTFLRNNFYQDILPFFTTNGAIRGPAGSGKFSPVRKSDVAEVAFRILMDPEKHTGKTYNLTGPEDLSCQEIADLMGCQYVDESEEEAWESRRFDENGKEVEEWLVDAWISTYRAIGKGELEGVSRDVEEILGRKAERFEDMLSK